jgi:hypothetical protein
MLRKCFRFVAIVALTVSAPLSAIAATTGTQTFTVNVPTAVSIVAPSAVSLTHDESDNANAFPVQTWLVKGNDPDGVNVEFSTTTPFVGPGSSKADVRLDLAVLNSQGPASWTVTTAQDTTDYANTNPDNSALVAAQSNGVGRANLDLTVSFLGGEFGTYAAGAYATTVTGTVAAR